MPDNQNVSIWDNPMYAWQQQLAGGANLAKNLNWQTLLGLTLVTGIVHWLGDKYYNWLELQKQKAKYPPDSNPVAINSAVHDALIPQGDADLGWKPQSFPTANKLFTDTVTPKPSSWDWRQNIRQNFSMPPTPTATPTVPTPTTTRPTTPSTTVNPWGNPSLKIF